MNWDELESERRHLTAADQDKLEMLQQIRDLLRALTERQEEAASKARAHEPEWEIEVSDLSSSAEARGTSRIGWEPFAVWNANIYWRRQVK